MERSKGEHKMFLEENDGTEEVGAAPVTDDNAAMGSDDMAAEGTEEKHDDMAV